MPKSVSGWTIAVFGALALGNGILGLAVPGALVGPLGFATPLDGAAATFLAASSMASLNMGVYYLLAAAKDWKPFFLFTVPFRALTVTVFTLLVLVGPAPAGFLAVAVWEGLGALATGAALLWERRRATMIVA